MDHVRIFKELHSLACLLEDNGKFIESSKITNVMTRIAQGTAPTGNAGTAGTGVTGNSQQPQQQQQFTLDQRKGLYKTRFIEMLKLRNLAESIRQKRPQNGLPEYTIDKDGYKINTGLTTYVGKTLRELYDKFMSGNPDLRMVLDERGADKKQEEVAVKVSNDIASAELWPDPKNDPKITEEINKEYELGYNLLAGTYYIGKITNKSDFIDKKNINDLKDVFTKLGEHYASHNNQFPVNIYQIYGDKDPGDVNEAIIDILNHDEGSKFDYYKTKYINHPNSEEIKQGFVQEYNRRNPDKPIK
jgi:hypothetical protein